MTHEHKDDHAAQEQLKQDAHHHEQANHHTEGHAHSHSDSRVALSKEDRTLLKLRELVKPLLPHGHGHHHHQGAHVQYNAPRELTDALALYSIKKLSVLDHHMPAKDSRLINPVKPGVVSWLALAGMTTVNAVWLSYVFRTAGLRGFIGKGGIISAGLLASEVVGIRVIDELREMAVASRRKQLADSYRKKYGDAYLLSVLNPTFSLSHH